MPFSREAGRKQISGRLAAKRAIAHRVFKLGLAAALQRRLGDQQLQLAVLNKEVTSGRKRQRSGQVLAAGSKGMRTRGGAHMVLPSQCRSPMIMCGVGSPCPSMRAI